MAADNTPLLLAAAAAAALLFMQTPPASSSGESLGDTFEQAPEIDDDRSSTQRTADDANAIVEVIDNGIQTILGWFGAGRSGDE